MLDYVRLIKFSATNINSVTLKLKTQNDASFWCILVKQYTILLTVVIAKLSPNFNSSFNLGLGLVLVSLNPATQPPTHPTYQKSSFQALDDFDLKGKTVSLND